MITGDFKGFKDYIRDCSAAIFSEESNSAHDWFREVHCGLNVDGVSCDLLIKEVECGPDTGDFLFNFNLEFVLPIDIDKNKAKELICWVADEMQFHPNIRVLDRTEHSDGSGFPGTGVEPIGSDRYFWIQPQGFKHDTDLERYNWEGVPHSARRWTSNMLVIVKLTPSDSEGWGRSFDLGLDAVDLLRIAIRQRDARLEQKRLAEERAIEEKRLAEERVERQWRESRDKLEVFLKSIGDFDISGVPFSGCWKFQTEKTDGPICLSLFRGDWDSYLYLDVMDDFDCNVNKVIKWAVDHGAREPEAAAV